MLIIEGQSSLHLYPPHEERSPCAQHGHENMYMKQRVYVHDILPHFKIIPQANEVHHEVMQNYQRTYKNNFKVNLVQKGK